VRLATRFRRVRSDPIMGHISLGNGIEIHPELPTADGRNRHCLLQDLSRTFAATDLNILEARCAVVAL
jgi:hypothetical protein